ncbi:hypothetical protein WMF27_30425 [Sorangium sp. So ce281]|uniref:hypothetical protein n=1 Tax=unclassified Sorangium TaxID=2621164 RepID=UPI003F61D1DD
MPTHEPTDRSRPHEPEPPGPAFHPGPIVRNTYFYGMLLEAQDMTEEQQFHLGNIRRHLAELHGCGTAAGLRVDAAGGCEAVIVRRGVAIDCLGREIRVAKDVRVPLREAVAKAVSRRKERLGLEDARLPSRAGRCDPEPVEVYLSLCYDESPERPVQALGGPDAGGCAPACASSRARHGFRVDVSVDAPEPGPWSVGRFLDHLNQCERERLDTLLSAFILDDVPAQAAAGCRERHGCVGLARIRVVPGGEVIDIDNCAIRDLVLPTALIAGLARHALNVARRGR